MNKKVLWFLGIFIVLYFSLGSISEFYVNYEWFGINNGLNIFWILFFSKFNVGTAFTIFFILLFFLNFLLIRVLGGKGRIFTNNILDRLQIPVLGSPRRALFILLALGVITVGVIMGSAGSAFWKEFLLFRHGVSFEGFPTDPIFNKNISFYVFSLPFYKFLYGWFMSSLVLISGFSLFFHFLNGGILVQQGRFEFSLFARAHISTLLGSIVFLNGLGYRLSAYELLFEQKGKFFGAGYTAVNANLLAYNVAMVISFIAAALLLFNIFKRSFKLPLIVLATLLPAYFIIGTIYPSLQQRFVVDPNELEKEKPFIEHNIKFTRIAYGIDKIKEIEFPNKKNLTYRDIQKNRELVENIRLWDWRPLKQTYKQLQELKPYYYFNDVDVDRYIVDGKKTAFNLSARELSIDNISKAGQTWQNRQLMYTHGYGLVMSRVDRITSEGQPEMVVYDIPPKNDIGIKIDRPEIYYGEHNNSYVITNTNIKPGEFDYPSGDENKYTTYQGNGGTVLDSFFKKIMFALSFKDINILISQAITRESRILYRRNILDMIQTLTPFIEIDSDPYIVLSEGKMYWMIDAYTVSDRFPYSMTVKVGGKEINYIRNSVKITVDAYNGTINYYVVDEKDPIIKTYMGMFPGVFKKISAMSPDLQSHVRYAAAMFEVQSNMLLRYHMTDPNMFYNNEDAWHVARQVYEGNEEEVRSYYLVTRLPGEKVSEFILTIPFTPYKKNNMIGFMTAKCDMPDYGQLQLYTLPKEKLSYGPLQIEARIDQDADISKQLTLWGQKGSGVIRGNMLAIPIEESLLFIEPLYLKADTSEMPELKRVIVSFGDKIVMEKDLNSAIEKLFYSGSLTYMNEEDSRGTYAERIKDLAGKAYTHYTRAEQSMRDGDWKQYGEELKNLKDVLTMMKNIRN